MATSGLKPATILASADSSSPNGVNSGGSPYSSMYSLCISGTS